MRVLVTGGAGFIGSHACRALSRRGDHVVTLDNFNDFYDPRLKRENAQTLTEAGVEVVQADICERERLRDHVRRIAPDVIVHLAAWPGVGPSMKRPEVYMRNNIEGTINVFEAARERPNTRVVFASSSSVYGGQNQTPFVETMDVDHPISAYAGTKRACEMFAEYYHRLFGMHIWALRFFTCYGPAQRPDLAIHSFTRLIDRGDPVPMFGDGSTCRDYLFIDDCIKGVLAAVDRCSGYEVINLGESHTVRLDRLIELIAREVGKPARIQQLPEQPGHMRITFADVRKAERLLDYRPGTLIEDGIREFVRWYRTR